MVRVWPFQAWGCAKIQAGLPGMRQLSIILRKSVCSSMAYSTDKRLFRVGSQLRRGICLSLILVLGLGLGACRRKTPEEMLKEASDLFGNRDILGAEMKYEKILERNSEGELAAYARMGLANCYFADNDFARGREQCDIVLKMIGTKSPQYINVLDQKIGSFFREKKPEQAITAAIETSATLHGAPEPLRQEFQLMMAGIYLNNSKEDKTIEICNRAIHDWPDNSQLHLAALNLMTMGPQNRKDFTKAIGIYETFLKEHPKTTILPEIYFGIGFYQKNMNQPDKAKASFDLAEQDVQKQLAAALGAEAKGALLVKLSRIQQGRGNIPAARETLQRVVKEYPKTELSIQAQFLQAQMSLEENKPQDAIATLNQIIKDQPDSPAAMNASRGIQQIQAQAMRMTSGTLGMARTTTGTQTMAPTSATQASRPAPAGAVTTPATGGPGPGAPAPSSEAPQIKPKPMATAVPNAAASKPAATAAPATAAPQPAAGGGGKPNP